MIRKIKDPVDFTKISLKDENDRLKLVWKDVKRMPFNVVTLRLKMELSHFIDQLREKERTEGQEKLYITLLEAYKHLSDMEKVSADATSSQMHLLAMWREEQEKRKALEARIIEMEKEF